MGRLCKNAGFNEDRSAAFVCADLEALVGQGPSEEGLLVVRLQLQRCVAVLLGLTEPLQL